jgi:hypothetical protein
VMEYWYPLFSVGMQVFNRAAMGEGTRGGTGVGRCSSKYRP